MRAYLAAYSRSNGVLKYTSASGMRVSSTESNFFGRNKQRPELLYELTAFEFFKFHYTENQYKMLNLQKYHPVVRDDFNLLMCRYNFDTVIRGVEGFCLDNPEHFNPHRAWLVSRASHLLSYFKQGFHNQELSDEDKRYLANAERLIEDQKSSA